MLQKFRNKWFTLTQKNFEIQNPNPKTKETFKETELKTNLKIQTSIRTQNGKFKLKL